MPGVQRFWRNFSGVICVAVIAVIGPCRFDYFSVCTSCGAIRHTAERELPLLSIPYWTSHSIEATPLNRACATTQLVGEHQHAWQFGQGSTFPLWSCSLGRGSSVTGQVMSDHIATFIKNVAEFGSHGEAKKWLRLTLDANTSHHVCGALVEGHFPEAGFQNAGEYKEWSAASLQKLDAFVAEMVDHREGR